MVSFISTVGFPIFIAVTCFRFITKITSNMREDNNKREEQMQQMANERENKLYNQFEKFDKTLDNFNTTLIKIDSRLEIVERSLNK